MRIGHVLSVLVLGSTVWAADLSVDMVAPESAVLVLQVDGLAGVVGRLESSGIVEEDDLEAFRDGIRQAVVEIPSEHARPWIEVLEDGDPIEIVSALSMGLAIWNEPTASGDPTIEGVFWIDLGEQADVLGPALDDAWASQRESADVSTEEIAGREVDVMPLGLARPEAAPEGMPTSVMHVREDRWVVLATSSDAMQRVLDLLDDTLGDDTLADSDTWQAIRGMLGEDHTVVGAAFIDQIFEVARVFDSMGVSHMVRQSFDPTMGPVRALGMSAGTGRGSSILDWSAAAYMPEGLGGVIELFSKNTPVESLPGWIGPDVVSVSRYNVDFRSIIPWLRSVIASNPMMMGMDQAVDQIEPMAKAILGPLDQRTMSVRTLTRPLTPESISEVMWVHCTDAEALSDALSDLAAKGGFKPREFQGHQIWTMEGEGGMGMMGLGMGSMSLAVTPGGLLAGNAAGVEAVLRGLGSRGGSSPEWLERVRSWLPSADLCAWGGSDLAESLTAVVEVQEMQIRQWEDKLAQQDPELWEEIRGELIDEESRQRNERMAAMAGRLGPAGWWISSSDDGVRLVGAILAADDSTSSPDAGTSP